MNNKTKEILKTIQNKNVGIFFDDSNIYYAGLKNKWKMNIIKFKEFFMVHCNLVLFNYYVATPKEKDELYLQSLKFINNINKFVTIKTKTIKYIFNGKDIIKKANFDIEICLDIVRNINNLDVVIIVSGDSDFNELKIYLLELNKKIIFVCYNSNLSFELKQGKYILLEHIREFIE